GALFGISLGRRLLYELAKLSEFVAAQLAVAIRIELLKEGFEILFLLAFSLLLGRHGSGSRVVGAGGPQPCTDHQYANCDHRPSHQRRHDTLLGDNYLVHLAARPEHPASLAS